jgi:endo-1,4-beta-mannosidase
MMKSFRTSSVRATSAAFAAALAALLVGCWRGGSGPEAPAALGAARDGLLPVTPTNTPSAVFVQDGQPLCFSGTNNYYLNYRDKAMVDDVFAQAKAMGLKVIRTWAFIDRGSIDDSVPSIERNSWEPYGTKQGVYFQYWDTAARAVAYNEGAEKEDGLVRLDYTLTRAAEAGIKVVLVLTNNWKELGGMDQYLKWFNLQYHHQFYTDSRARQAYKNYAAHLIRRVNTISKVAYADDPTIFAWELANQPRCRNFGQYDRADDCHPSTITEWVREMSEHIKSLDQNHMVAVGDEGYFNRPGQSGDQYNGAEGVDHEAFLALRSIDYGTFHLYPDLWSTGARWAQQWIVDHVAAAQRAGKPTVLEEYGVPVKRDEKTGKVTSGYDRRRVAYTNWNNLLLQGGGNAAMFWMLAGSDPRNESTGLYPDHDHFSVYNTADDDSAVLLRDYAQRFAGSARACALASAGGLSVPSSPFVRAVRPPVVASQPSAPAPPSPAPAAPSPPPAPPPAAASGQAASSGVDLHRSM